jgi:hypothetical protein
MVIENAGYKIDPLRVSRTKFTRIKKNNLVEHKGRMASTKIVLIVTQPIVHHIVYEKRKKSLPKNPQ